MNFFSFYHKDTGVLSAKKFGCSSSGNKLESILSANTPRDHIAVVGNFDPISQRYDFESKTVVSFIPEATSPNHEWNPLAKRWQLNQFTAKRFADDRIARQRIDELEKKQLRSIRELLIDPNNSQSIAVLQSIEAEIESHRLKVIK